MCFAKLCILKTHVPDVEIYILTEQAWIFLDNPSQIDYAPLNGK